MIFKNKTKPILALAPMADPALREGRGRPLNFTL